MGCLVDGVRSGGDAIDPLRDCGALGGGGFANGAAPLPFVIWFGAGLTDGVGRFETGPSLVAPNMRVILSFMDALSAGFGRCSGGIAPLVTGPWCGDSRGDADAFFCSSKDLSDEPDFVDELLLATDSEAEVDAMARTEC